MRVSQKQKVYTVVEMGASREGIREIGRRAGPTITVCENAVGQPIPLCVSLKGQMQNTPHLLISLVPLCKVTASVVGIPFQVFRTLGFTLNIQGNYLGPTPSQRFSFVIFYIY